ncbi:MAG: hypothetical protein WA637_10150, partial [Terriglobales bacterium]
TPSRITALLLPLPNGRRVSGERRAEGDERVRCTRALGGPFISSSSADGVGMSAHDPHPNY